MRELLKYTVVVEILEAKKVDWETVGLNAILRSGTRVRTKRSSTAKLKFDDGSIIHMKADSLILIRELTEDEQTLAKSSNIELGVSEIEALIPRPRIVGSQFLITMPDQSQARIETESNFSVKVNPKKRSVIRVFIGQVDVLAGERNIAIKAREAVILDGKKRRKNLTPISIPLPPKLIYPANVQLLSYVEGSDTPFYFRWTSIEGAEQYDLQVAKDYYFYDSVAGMKTRDNKAKIKALTEGNYYWRVISINKDGLASEPSPFNSFRVVSAGNLELQQRDLIPPKVQIDQLNRLGHIVDISGRTEPNASLYVNEQQEQVRDNGAFRALIEFKTPGLHEIFIEAYDSAGNITSINRSVTIPESATNPGS